MSPALAVVERVAKTERVISYIRAGVVAFNVATYLAFSSSTDPRRELALFVCFGAILYTVAMLVWRPPADSRTIAAAITGTVVDTLLIGVWIYATNGFESPYYPVLYAEAAATVGRFGLTLGLFSGVASSIVYLVASDLGNPSVDGSEMAIRVAYIFAIIAFVGYVVEIAKRSEHYTAAAEAEAEALREVDKLRSTFVTHISHELRTPLTAVRGAAVTLNGKGSALKSEEAAVLIDMIDRQSERLSGLIEDIIDIGLIEEGRFSARMETVDLAELVAHVVSKTSVNGERKIVFDRRDDRARVVGDAPKLRSAIKKVLDNAVKFSGPAEPVVVTLEDDNDDYRIRVRDNGIGVSAEHRGRIFENFFQVDPTLSRAQPGTGVGLSIARAILQMHGGDIELHPEDRGSTFTLRLPKNGRGATLYGDGTTVESGVRATDSHSV